MQQRRRALCSKVRNQRNHVVPLVFPRGGFMSGNSSSCNQNIYVVDNDKRYRDEIRALLVRVGYKVQVFACAEDLLERYDGEPVPACIISENALPGMSGLDLTRELRLRNISSPVIILTRQSDVATAVKALRNNVSDYLVKPFVERDLVNRLRVAIEVGL